MVTVPPRYATAARMRNTAAQQPGGRIEAQQRHRQAALGRHDTVSPPQVTPPASTTAGAAIRSA
jgi:hypothetical protein